jgi:methylthioribose-1-phosphate isomerase
MAELKNYIAASQMMILPGFTCATGVQHEHREQVFATNAASVRRSTNSGRPTPVNAANRLRKVLTQLVLANAANANWVP